MSWIDCRKHGISPADNPAGLIDCLSQSGLVDPGVEVGIYGHLSDMPKL